MEQRWCPRCKETKSLSEYYILKSGSRAGRVQGWCKFCQNRQRKESLASDPVRKALKKKRDSTYHTKYYQANRERILEQNRAWRLANRDTLRLSQRARYLLDTYGLSLEQYGVMFEAQKGVCALCGEVDQHGNRLAVDHSAWLEMTPTLLKEWLITCEEITNPTLPNAKAESTLKVEG
jgi:hypothetical protein